MDDGKQGGMYVGGEGGEGHMKMENGRLQQWKSPVIQLP